MDIAVTPETIFVLTCFAKDSPEALVPVVIIAESKEKATELLREGEPDVEVLSVANARELTMLLAIMGEAATGEVPPFIVQPGYAFGTIFG